jgi:opacity protein-like surface antigen
MQTSLDRPRRPIPAASRHILGLAGIAVVALLPLTAAADRGLSIHLLGGTSRISDPSTTFGGASGRLLLDSGKAYGGGVGWRFSPSWRLEGEVVYRNNEVRGTSVPGLDPSPADADYASVALMANLLWDIGRWPVGPVTLRPYLGLGIGRLQELDTDLRVGGQAAEFSGSGRAHQFLAGLEWDYRSPWTAGVGLRRVGAGRVTLAGPQGSLAVGHRGWGAELRLGYRF